MSKVLVITGHPNPDSFSAAMARAYAAAAQRDGADVQCIALAELDFDPLLRRSYHAEQPLEPDLVTARDAIVRAEHVAWFFPMWWASPPALVKAFIERVFTPGFAFRYRGRNDVPEKLLRGRSARLVTSMDCPAVWYNFANRRALHAAFGFATLGFVGFAPVRSTTFHEVRFLTAAERGAALARVERDARADVRACQKQRRAAPELAAQLERV